MLTSSVPIMGQAGAQEANDAIAEPHSSVTDRSIESSRFSRYLADLAIRPSPDLLDLLSPATVDGSMDGTARESQAFLDPDLTPVNPEINSYAYIETLLEALFVLGKLGSALETISQRVTGEIHALVETTLDEVEERSAIQPERAPASDIIRSDQRRDDSALARPQSVSFIAGDATTDRSTRRQSLITPTESLRIAVSLDSMGPAHHAVLLRDLFWTLYSKLAAVLEGHRVIYEVARWIPSVSCQNASMLLIDGRGVIIAIRQAPKVRRPRSRCSRSGNPFSKRSATCSTCTSPTAAKVLCLIVIIFLP